MLKKQAHIRLTLWLLTFAFVVPQLAFAKDKAINPDKAADIKELVEMSRLEDVVLLSANSVLDQILPMLKKAMATKNSAVIEAVLEIARDTTMSVVERQIWSPGGLVDRVIPIYDKHYTRGEIQALIKFYKSPLGQKVASLKPQITKEGIMVAEQWLKFLNPLLVQAIKMSLEKEGYVVVKKDQK